MFQFYSFLLNIHARSCNSFFRKQPKHCSTYFNIVQCTSLVFFEVCHDRVVLVRLGVIGFKWLMVVNEVTGFDKLVVCSGATPSGNSVEAGLILPLLNFWVNFSSVSIKCLRFYIMTFPFSFWAVYNPVPLLRITNKDLQSLIVLRFWAKLI